MIQSFCKKKLASSRGAPQENDAIFRFAINPQGIRQFHDNCKIAKCQTVATLASVYQYPRRDCSHVISVTYARDGQNFIYFLKINDSPSWFLVRSSL